MGLSKSKMAAILGRNLKNLERIFEHRSFELHRWIAFVNVKNVNVNVFPVSHGIFPVI